MGRTVLSDAPRDGVFPIEDCVLLRTKNDELVAYVVSRAGASPTELEAGLKAALPADRQPSACVPLASMPLTTSGEVDERVLGAIPVVDADLVKRWEESLRSRSEIDRVAVVVHEGPDPEPRVALADLLPPGPDPTEKAAATIREPAGRATAPAARRRAPALVDAGPSRVRPEDPRTLPEALARAARTFPGNAIVYHHSRAEDDTQTFGELLLDAERVLAGLRSFGVKPGSNVLLVLEGSRDILSAFWGCVLGGFVPVVTAPPATGDAQRAVGQLRGVFDQLGGPFVVAADEALGPESWLTALESPRAATVSALRDHSPDHGYHACEPDDVAFYSLTSGSTGIPKCVMLTHRNVLRRARGMDELCATTSDDVILNWLPFDHIGSLSDWHLRCVALGCRSVYVAKEAILERPLHWLDLLDRYRATHSWAPTFAYRLINDALARDPRAPWDLSCVKGLLSAGEQVSLEVETALRERLGRCGLRKESLWSAFGMAETASGITYERPTESAPRTHHGIDRASLDGELVAAGPEHPNRVVFSSLGRPIPGMSIRIVDEGNEVLPEFVVGRLQVKGDAVTRGFYGNPEATREVFREDGWFETGDRGFVADGQLVLTGRGKDVIVVNGANYASAEIEAVVEEVPGTPVSFTVACAVRRPGSDLEELALFFPTVLRPATGLAKLLRAIQARVVQRLGFKPSYLVPLERSDVGKTAIGKLRRQDLKRRFEGGEFDRVLREVDALLGRETTLPDWFHRKIWRRSEARAWSVRPPPGVVLVFVDRTGLGESVRRAIEASGSSCVAVESGTRFSRLGAGRYRIASASRDHYRWLLEAVGEEADRVDEVLHFWNFGEAAAEVAGREELERAQEAGIFSLLFLAQTLSEVRGAGSRVALRVISSRTEAVRPGDPVAYERTPVLGLLRSLAHEMPWLEARHLDLAADSLESNSSRVMTERTVDAREDRVAYREGRRFVVRLEKTDLSREPARSPAFKDRGTYLVCGESGGAGPALVQYMRARHGARVLFVASPSAGAGPVPARGEPTAVEADVSDAHRMRELIAEAKSRWSCGLDGIVFLSEAGPGRLLAGESRYSLWGRLERELVGAWVLHRLAREERDCLFLLVSSVHDLIPEATHGVSAIASSFHEGLASFPQGHTSLRACAYRCAPGLRAEDAVHSWVAGLLRDRRELVVGLDGRDVSSLGETAAPALQRLTAYLSADTPLDTAALGDRVVTDRFGTPSRCELRQLREPAHAPAREIELWPSVAEHFVYDDLIYYALASDERRNQSYRKAIDRLVKGKTVVDVGTGTEAILARICAEAGAHRVYAVELGEEACRAAARRVKSLGLDDQITVLQGDVRRIELPEPVDVCVSEIVGPIGGCEGAAVLLNAARRLLKPTGTMIPARSVTRIAAVRLPDVLLERPRFRVVPRTYAQKIFEAVGHPFDLRLCVRNFPRSHVLSNVETFEVLDFGGPLDAEFRREVRLVVSESSRLDGLLLWLNLHTIEGEVIDILEHDYVWLPVYFPIFSPGVEVSPGDTIQVTCRGTLSDNGTNPDYHVEGRLTRGTGEVIPLEHHSYHHRPVLRQSAFHARLFGATDPPFGPGGAPEATTEYLAEMPLTETGEVDRERLLEIARSPGRGGRERPAPVSDVEREITAIWREVLQQPEVGTDENFFELGGHSLLLVQVQGRLQERFGPAATLVELFKYPTVRSLAAFIGQTAPAAATPSSHGRERARVRGARDRTRRDTDVAVVGMSCRFPGADGLAEFWRNLREGRESITSFSYDDVAGSGIHRAALDHPDYVRASAILSDVESFDAEFFEYTPHQARLMDPQHRLALECAWECLESAGYDPFTDDSIVGIYAGSSMNTYLLNQVMPNRHRLDENDDLRVTTVNSVGGFEMMLANDKDYLTTRIAYKLNLRGPAITVQTACSTSLVTVHMACQSLIAGECDMALAGGVSVQVPQRAGHLYHEGIMLSPDGHCRAFDARAVGTVFGSGVGMVLLKPLADASRDGDFVWAVVKGSAVNNDGHRKLNYMAPSGDGQAAVTAEAIGMSGVDADTITYLETHGTGTILGDSIEIEGLTQAFRAQTLRKGFCAIGSVKTNLGHLQIASGMASLIKTVLALHHRELPPSLHFEKPNPRIDFSNSPFFVNTRLVPWETQGTPRRAGVNALGIGGTNAHVVLEEAPERPPANHGEDGRAHLFTLSARNAQALEDLARRYREALESSPKAPLEALCYTVNRGRRHFRHRVGIVAESSAEVLAGLRAMGEEGSTNRFVRGEVPRKERPRLAMVCAGEGSEHVGMGRRLYETLPAFRETVDRCGEWMPAILYAPEGRPFERAEHAHPALFALEAALLEVWKSWGVKPALLHGRGVGEYVAAWAAGVLDLEDALMLVRERARALEHANGRPPDPTGLGRAARRVAFREPHTDLIPGAPGAGTASDMVEPDYWVSQLEQGPGGAKSLPAVLTSPSSLLLTMEPHPRGEDDWRCLMRSLGVLYSRGVEIDWAGVHGNGGRRRVLLPTYPFQRQRHWMDAP
jgi:acyl-CoA synthetase (AMP-forming)/AMP-acid ligase II/3-oxoacyl-(acyl-carrier-protein) synthase/acyl carrier protein